MGKDRLLIHSVEDILSAMNNVVSKKTQKWTAKGVHKIEKGWDLLFPRVHTASPRFKRDGLGGWFIPGTSSRYCSARVANWYHPDAEGYVYVQAFKGLSNFEDFPFAYAEEHRAYVKIGLSNNPNTRLKTLVKDAKNIFGEDVEYRYPLAMFPCSKYGIAETLEEYILGSMLDADMVQGEWYLDNISVWKRILFWAIMAHYSADRVSKTKRIRTNHIRF